MSDEHNTPVLRRIKYSIVQIGRLLEYEKYEESKRLINNCFVNLNRIRHSISRNKYDQIKNSLDSVSECCEPVGMGGDILHYAAERCKSRKRGRPAVSITRQQLLFFQHEGYTASKIANLLHCSKSLVYRRYYEENIKLRDKYCNLNNDELGQKIQSLAESFPRSGSEMMSGLLKSQGIYAQRERVRRLLCAANPHQTAVRWGNTVQRRIYSVPTPNSLWHMDAHLKLSR
ncbi:hypothetical protein NQ315_017592 [Exocentrus adspersus]|uniref:Resolvase HTH domain-containing protein n=1 Tax=Exocentrus adspersus TaxID=1586481 RepID=A0AAV8VIE1_9CUCU|nr:hypothetical protein NQ315_017592 [Exocentrus adspersus]